MLLRFDPFRELDRLTDQLAGQATSATPAIAMDALKRGDTVEIRFDLPGFDAGSIDLEVDRNVLTLNAERPWSTDEGVQVIARERRYGRFSGKLLLGDALDGSDVNAEFRDGVLTVTIPVAEAAKPRKVSIGNGGAESRAIDVSESEQQPGRERELSSSSG